jgi:hypothetical protein
MPSVRIGDAEIYYERHGNGYPLVLSHQGFSSIENWDLNLGELSSERLVSSRPTSAALRTARCSRWRWPWSTPIS